MLKSVTTGLLVYLVLNVAQAGTLDGVKTRCVPETAGDLVLYSDEFKNTVPHLGNAWWWTLSEMGLKFDEVYKSGKRLPSRAYYNEKTKNFVLPFTSYLGPVAEVPMPEHFIRSITKHIENALKYNYADYIFFPDMGHSHFYFPKDHWDKTYTPESLGVEKYPEHYAKMLADTRLKVLYHTAEKLLLTTEDGKVSKDPELEFRYWNRNIVGDNQESDVLEVHVASDGKYNTVGSIPGFALWSSGFNISASEQGCFPYFHNGKTYYFDVSFRDLVPVPGSEDYM